MIYYKKLNLEELSEYDYKRIKKIRFEHMTDQEKLKVIETFENDYSFWIITGRMQKVLGFDMDRYVDVKQNNSFQKLNDYLRKEFSDHNWKDDVNENKTMHIFHELERSAEQTLQSEEKFENLSVVIDTITKRFFDQNPRTLFKTIKKEAFVSYLTEIERNDLASFVEYFGRKQYRVHLDEFFHWTLHDKEMFFELELIEDEFEKTIKLIQENIPLSREEKRLLNEHRRDIEFYQREQKALAEDEGYEGYDDDEWWEVVGEPRSKALYFIEKLINGKLYDIFTLWNKQEAKKIDELKQIFKFIILSNCYRGKEIEPLFKQYTKDTLFKDETKLYVTCLQYDVSDDDEYYLYIEK